MCDFVTTPRKKFGAVTPFFTQVPSSVLQKCCGLGKRHYFSISYGSAYMSAACQAGVMLSKVPDSFYTLCIAIKYLARGFDFPISRLAKNLPCLRMAWI